MKDNLVNESVGLVNDCISRQAAIDALADMHCKSDEDGYVWIIRSDAWARIDALPSAQPQRMKGKWIHDGCDIPHGVDWMHCSVCGRREPYVPAAMTNYCPNCGSSMKGDNNVRN